METKQAVINQIKESKLSKFEGYLFYVLIFCTLVVLPLASAYIILTASKQ
jgi:hypothetical protein